MAKSNTLSLQMAHKRNVELDKMYQEEEQYFKTFGRWGKYCEEWDEEPQD